MAYTSNAVWFTVDKSEKLQIAQIKQIALKWQLKSTPENKPLNNIDVFMPLQHNCSLKCLCSMT